MAMEENLVEYHKALKRLEAVSLQRMQMEAQLVEMKAALELLEKEKPEKVYKMVGNLIVAVDREKAVEDLKKATSFLEDRVKKLKEEEEELKKKVRELQQGLNA